MHQNSSYDLEYVRSQFPALALTVNSYPAAYFDGPGGTQVPQRVLDAVNDYLIYCNANAGGKFLTSHNSDLVIREARKALADFLGASPDEIAFGQNMTTLNYQLALALTRSPGKRREIIITEIDHEANRGPWLALKERGYKILEVRMDRETCTIDMDDYKNKLSGDTFLAAINYASNGVGTINRVEEMIELAHQAGAITVVDAVHYALHGPVDVKKINADYLLCSAYKFFGPHIGILYGKKALFSELPAYRLRTQSALVPNLIETGTLNHEGIAGTTEAVEFIADLGRRFGFSGSGSGLSGSEKISERRSQVLSGMRAMEQHEQPLAEKMLDDLASIQGVRVYGPPRDCPRTSTISFTIEGKRADRVAEELGKKGLFVWDGHFYAIRLVEKLGLLESGGLIRAGLCPYNTEQEVDRLLEEVKRLAK